MVKRKVKKKAHKQNPKHIKHKIKHAQNKNKHKRHKKHAETKKTREKEERIGTGIAEFDKLIEKGFKKNTANLIVGGAGSGKTIFATQFLLGGMKKGEKCLFITFEETKDEFYTNMLKFGWDLAEYEKKGLFIFLEYTPIKVKTMLEEGGGEVETTIIKEKVKRLVIDSITSFALLFDDELQKKEAALSLFNMIGKWDCTSLLTFEGEPLHDEKIASRTLEFESDSIILFYYKRDKKERQRYLEILKMRGTKHSRKVYKFSIDKNGIVISPHPVRIEIGT